MMDLYSHFCQQLRERSVEHPVLALSGGVDSRVLLHLLAHYHQQYSIPVRAVHVHHGLSINANHWVEQCQHWCDEYQIPLSVEHVSLDTNSGESIEQLAREARYAVLSQHIQTHETLLLGHHADDQLETFLLALKRGSGPKGLSAMAVWASFSQGHLLRPLLHVPRQVIESFASQQLLQWVNDESNQDVRYERNFLRHRVTPILSERWPTIHQAVQRSAELCAEQEAVIHELLANLLASAISEQGGLSISQLQPCSEVIRRQLIRHWLAQQGVVMPSRLHTEMIWQQVALAESSANPKLQLKEYQIRRFDGELFCVASVGDIRHWHQDIQLNRPLILPDQLGRLTLSTCQTGHILLPKQPDAFWVSFNPEGLSACPVGRAGSRKLKKLFQEYRIPSWQRRRLPILMYKERVVAIASLFVDRDFSGQECELVWER
ncbi:tRNA lysidine(34) synthetase TilS [Vibrio cincinnatiensis]|uniref:tRNA lysidine(34) synthetase TilS n=1 Tax=Vibrio cincinnatiensis TaxID=675 RepID=UPI001EDDD753|nr:tRNA lysidine(34) synthetase TilS [Vibrio cincinnatiensis]MCG3758471.1 tRNA lysidine(34) synthetase TilS [Vibrio cincinnatiensis]MCG3761707.1 tRNA lysidine(34) synthetase TilS [Vibrio cincinnatiensis]